MSEHADWSCPAHLQPKAEEVAFDLQAALASVVLLKARIPEDAFTASILGTERVGSGVVIGEDGLILTVGYLITEADSVWITANDGTVVAGHPLAYDFASGFGLVLPLARLPVAPLARGSSASVGAGDDVIAIGAGGRAHALNTQVFAKREFAGYWEYVLDAALFTTPPHPAWSGAALVDDGGQLVGIGSLFVQGSSTARRSRATCSSPSISSRPFSTRCSRQAGPPVRRGRGSACTRSSTTAGSSSARSPMAVRRMPRACIRATPWLKSLSIASRISRRSSAGSGASGPRERRFRSPSRATARRSR
jgi:S1-C subfamily serine protease